MAMIPIQRSSRCSPERSPATARCTPERGSCRRASAHRRSALLLIVSLVLWAGTGHAAHDEEGKEPELPPGLAPAESGRPQQPPDEPALPEGLGGERHDAPASAKEPDDESDDESDEEKGGEPSLPAGLGGERIEAGDAPAQRDGPSALEAFLEPVTGFLDVRAGVRVRDDPHQRALSLAETRLQLSRDSYFGSTLLRVTADLVYDDLAAVHEPQLEQGRGWLDLREAYVGGPVADWMDLRAGRQVLTWGVGDLLFLNDLFPKDWNSFFTGRDVEYLKAPSDAVRAAVFLPAFNIDVVYTPKFDPDRFVDHRRLSFFDPRAGRVVGRDVTFEPVRPSDWFADDEVAFRVYRLLDAWEVAAYGYRGFWKSPEGFDPVSGRPLFPALESWGASVRGPVGPGIVTAETAWYRSLDDLAGDDPFLPNSQFRWLVGYEQEVVANLTLGGQYYLERTLDHDALTANQPPGFRAPDEHRHVVTLRLRLLTHSQNVTWSLFTFASPSDNDAYIRGLWEWKATDSWTWSAGFNLFEGKRRDTFFGQFETNSNVYAALRYGF